MKSYKDGYVHCRICSHTLKNNVDTLTYHCNTCMQNIKNVKPTQAQRTARHNQALLQNQQMRQWTNRYNNGKLARGGSGHSHSASDKRLANGNQPEKEKTINEKYPDIRSTIPKYSEIED